MLRRRVLPATVFGAGAAWATLVNADTYPSKPIT